MKTRGSGNHVTKLFLRLSVSLVVCVMAAASTPCVTTLNGGSDAAVQPRPEEPARPKQEGFEMKKVGSRYEPVVHYDTSVFRLPGTQMTFAAYNYLIPDDNLPPPKYGFLFDDGRFFYVDEAAASHGDAQYALGDGYFVVDGYAFTSSHDRSMYLFRYGEDWVKLLDMIGDKFAAHNGYEFMSDYPGKPAYGEEITEEYKHTPVWITKERDGHGNPLIRIKLYHDPFSYDLYKFYTDKGISADKYEELHLYVKIVSNRRGRRAGHPPASGPRSRNLQAPLRQHQTRTEGRRKAGGVLSLRFSCRPARPFPYKGRSGGQQAPP